MEFCRVGRHYSFLLEVLQSTHGCTFFIDVSIDRINRFLKPFLREKEVNSSLFGSSSNSSLGVPILNIVSHEGFSLYERWSFEESNSLKDLFYF